MHECTPYPSHYRVNHVPNREYCRLNVHHDRLDSCFHLYTYHRLAFVRQSGQVFFGQIAYFMK